jgi:hypothetical protein
VAGRTSRHGACPVAGCGRWRGSKLPQSRRRRRPADKDLDASRVRLARSHGQVVGRGLGRRGGWKTEEGWLTGTRRTSSTERTIDPGSARRGRPRDIALSPSPSVMTEEAVESGMAGFPEQSAPEQGVGCNGGRSSWVGSTDPLKISGSRANVSAAACVRKVRSWAAQSARVEGAGAQRSIRSDRIAPSLRRSAVPWAEDRIAAPDSGG